MADVDLALEQQVLDITQTQGEADIHDHHKADDLGRLLRTPENKGLAEREVLGN